MVDFEHNGTRNWSYMGCKGIFPAPLKWIPTLPTQKAGLNYKD